MKKQTCQIVDIKSKRHELPLDVILFHMINFRKIKGLPLNQDCTSILKAASERVLDSMFSGNKYYVETFMPRHSEFQERLAYEIEAFNRGEWGAAICVMREGVNNDNSLILV